MNIVASVLCWILLIKVVQIKKQDLTYKKITICSSLICTGSFCLCSLRILRHPQGSRVDVILALVIDLAHTDVTYLKDIIETYNDILRVLYKIFWNFINTEMKRETIVNTLVKFSRLLLEHDNTWLIQCITSNIIIYIWLAYFYWDFTIMNEE